MSVGAKSLILNASESLKASLCMLGEMKHFPPAGVLFRVDDENAGVFLVIGGKVSMSFKALPRLDRVFGSGALLGLPSTFIERPYTLTATAITEADVVHVRQEEFIRLMIEQPDLCREATEILGREMAFIQSALITRRRQTASATNGGAAVA
jgi:CRP-like cAMP-binding protein